MNFLTIILMIAVPFVFVKCLIKSCAYFTPNTAAEDLKIEQDLEKLRSKQDTKTKPKIDLFFVKMNIMYFSEITVSFVGILVLICMGIVDVLKAMGSNLYMIQYCTKTNHLTLISLISDVFEKKKFFPMVGTSLFLIYLAFLVGMVIYEFVEHVLGVKKHRKDVIEKLANDRRI